jgi:AcrR family transcriptional regulator
MDATLKRTAVVPAERPYHHGDLASALLDASEAELAEKGIEAFSLRGVAKRAGVSHAAPAHHFGDVDGLLTALAARGFERFLARQETFRQQARHEPQAQLQASGLGYVVFALENPALFRLMFGSRRPDFGSDRLGRAASTAFEELVRQVAEVTGNHTPPTKDRSVLTDVGAAWAIVHGLADLLAAGRLPSLGGLPEKARNRAILAIVGRAVNPGDSGLGPCAP